MRAKKNAIRTSLPAAKKASKILKDQKSSKDLKTVAGSALVNAKKTTKK
jgi:hypothetical protein